MKLVNQNITIKKKNNLYVASHDSKTLAIELYKYSDVWISWIQFHILNLFFHLRMCEI